MMKKVLLLTLLPLMLSVSGCSKTEVKKPSFKSYSNEVSYEEFMATETSLTAANTILSGITNPSAVPSFETTISKVSKVKDVKNTIASGEKKKDSDYSVDAKITARVRFDSTKKAMAYSGNREATVIVSSNNGKKITEAVGFDSKDFQAQMHAIEDADPQAYLYNNKTMIAYNTTANENQLASFAAEISQSSLDDMYRPTIVKWASLTEEERGYYKFYVDDNVLTCVLKGKITSQSVDGEGNVVYNSTRRVSTISQFVYTETTYSHKVYVDNSYSEEAYADYQTMKKGDIKGGTELTALEVSIKANDKVSLTEKVDADYHIGDTGNPLEEYYSSLVDDLSL